MCKQCGHTTVKYALLVSVLALAGGSESRREHDSQARKAQQHVAPTENFGETMHTTTTRLLKQLEEELDLGGSD